MPFDGVMDAGHQICAGKSPRFPSKIQESNHPATIALIKAMQMYHVANATERPSARDVYDFLQKVRGNFTLFYSH